MWTIPFITEKQFTEHVQATIRKYGDKLEPFNLKKFNSNIIDPIKLIFDKTVYNYSWDDIVKNEISRQRDKSNNNDIGYFHQQLFSYIKGCVVPTEGWDVIYENPFGIELADGDKVHKIYVEMKNKHNTMNSASAGKTYMKMQHQLLDDDDCACFLVEVIAKKSQNIRWDATVDKTKMHHRRIRRVSIDKFYSMVTGDENSFYQICMALPKTIKSVVEDSTKTSIPHDTVMEELKLIAKKHKLESEDLSIALAIYLLGFDSYIGF